MKNKLVSIVLPVYNGEKYLRESIDSVIAQTYENWELIIVDDCSRDNTPSIAKEYVKKDKRIFYYRNEENLRLPRNLNRGFSLAKGEYLTWTSDDNRYRPKALETMYNVLEKHKNVHFVFASCRIINEYGDETEYIMVDKESPKRLVGENAVGACFMYTREAYESVGEYDPQYTLVEDFEYWQRIVTRFEAIGIEEILYDYRLHDGALTSTMRRDEFNRALEAAILKNRDGFGKLTLKQRYWYYHNLWKCRENLQDKNNPYNQKNTLYSSIYFVQVEIPNKIKRVIKRLLKNEGK